MSIAEIIPSRNLITAEEISSAQTAWAASVEDIGLAYRSGEPFEEEAERLLSELYAFKLGPVLFKPALARQVPFRNTYNDALSYFIGGDHTEDNGFALKPWRSVRFGEQTHIVNGTSALAMGHYHFTPDSGGDEVTAEFTFGYIRVPRGNLKINLHHSSLPYGL